MEQDIKYWVNLSEYDIKTAVAMLKSSRYLYVLFTCQQSVEKMLKALITKTLKQFPPKTHDLLRLLELSQVELAESEKEFISRLTFYYLETRYPQEILKISKETNKMIASEYLKRTKALLKWLKAKLK